jgi:hypothetical protein
MHPPPDGFPPPPGNPTPSASVPPRFRGVLSCALLPSLALSALLLAGCAAAQPKPAPDLADQGKALFGSSPASDPASPGSDAAQSWSIVIVAFRGPDQDADAATGLARIRSVGGLGEAYTRREGNTTVIAFGHYPSADDAKARADLARIHDLDVEGGKPFAGAVLAPPQSTGTGRVPDLDLRRARADFGKDALYTLQIAAYGRGDGLPPQSPSERAEFVRAAEDAASQLRREGEQAFYYHGPNMSLVTIGVFGPDDYDIQHPERQSDRLRAAREAHPDCLLNGKGMKVRVRGVPANSPNAMRPASSFIVAIPAEE